VSALFALNGVGFTGGNLLLAHALPRFDYAIVALWLAVYYLGKSLAPLGAEGVVNRRRIRPGWRLVRRTLLTSAVVATTTVIVGGLLYPLSSGHLLLLLVGVISGGLAAVAAAQYQARQRFLTAITISQGPNLMLLLAAGVEILLGTGGAYLPIVILALGQIGLCALGWTRLRKIAREEDEVGEPFAWSEALSFFAAAAAAAVFPQIERLVIPKVLTLSELASFAVLAALVISPYRMLQSGVGYTLFPRLRQAPDRRVRRRLLGEEVGTTLILAAGGGILVWYLAPWIVRLLLPGKYDLPGALVLAGIVAGVLKVLDSFGRATVSALGRTRELAAFGVASWGAVGVSLVGASIGARWGLPGLVYGTSAGWLARTAAGLWLGLPQMLGPEPPVAERREPPLD
jgi:O-antigen/teichoic acid export membrane protein